MLTLTSGGCIIGGGPPADGRLLQQAGPALHGAEEAYDDGETGSETTIIWPWFALETDGKEESKKEMEKTIKIEATTFFLNVSFK